MRAFSIDVKKEDIKQIFKEMNKEINDGVKWEEFV